MIYYKVRTEIGIDFSLAIPTSQYSFDDFIFFALVKKVDSPNYVEITQEEYNLELEKRFPKPEEPTVPELTSADYLLLELIEQDLLK